MSLNETRTVDWDPSGTYNIGDTVYLRAVSTRTGGDYKNPKYTAIRASEAIIGNQIDNLTELLDVTITTPTDGQLLTYDSVGSEWINADAPAGVPSIPGAGFHRTLRWDETLDEWVSNDTLLASSSGRVHAIDNLPSFQVYATGAGLNEKGTAFKQTHTSGFNPAFIIQSINDGSDGFGTNGEVLLSAGRTGISWDSLHVRVPTLISEQTLSPGGTVAAGTLWVKDDIPNTLYFTDDAMQVGYMVI